MHLAMTVANAWNKPVITNTNMLGVAGCAEEAVHHDVPQVMPHAHTPNRVH